MAGRKKKFGLSDQQIKFCEAYLTTKNAGRSYMEGYPKISSLHLASSAAGQLLKDPRIQAYLEIRREEICAKTDITMERILQEEACMAFSNVVDLFRDPKNQRAIDIQSLPEHVQRAIKDVYFETDQHGRQYVSKVTFHPKGSSIERLERHLGMFDKDNKQKGDAVLNLFEQIAAQGPSEPGGDKDG